MPVLYLVSIALNWVHHVVLLVIVSYSMTVITCLVPFFPLVWFTSDEFCCYYNKKSIVLEIYISAGFMEIKSNETREVILYCSRFIHCKYR